MMRISEILVDELTVKVKRIAKRRHILLTVEPKGICVKAPYFTPNREIGQFIHHHREWINLQQQKFTALPSFTEDDTFYFHGQPRKLRLQKGKALTELTDTKLIVRFPSLEPAVIKLRIKQFLEASAKSYFPPRLDKLAHLTKQYPSSLIIKSYKARWGCCSRKGDIAINWKLIMAPPNAIDYVLIHELCHLTHFNHSKQFWLLVNRYCPEHTIHKRWLSDHSHVLAIPF